MNYHSMRDKRKFIDLLNPIQSMQFHKKTMINQLADGIVPEDSKMTVDQKIKHLEKNT